MAFEIRLPTKTGLFAVLMAVSALLLLVGGGPLNWLRGVLQPIAILQRPVSDVIRVVTPRRVEGVPEHPTREQYQALFDENEQLRRQIAQQQSMIEGMHSRLTAVTGLRDQLRDLRGQIVMAPVVALDASPRRESLLIGRGSNQIAGLRPGLWVAAAPELISDEKDSGRERLARQVIIGRVNEVHPFTCRVQLISDPGFRNVPVRTARVKDDGTWQLVGAESLISGQGNGRMLMDRVPEDVFAAGARVVLLSPSSDLPAAMTLGRIESSRPRPDAPLFFDLDVQPWYPLNEFENVCVIVPGTRGSVD
ncbi:MAG: hypothetical protein JNG88_17025 [Phycisphaerales bacterium]|nr:hypothetical protein [Phycisphaerales bacterium]